MPWVFTPQLRRYDRSVLGPIKGLNSSERSVFDRTLVRQSWQRHLLQVGAVDTLLGRIIARMKDTGLYDRAALVVMADHGVSFHVGATDRRTILPRNAFDIAPIPLFMKSPRQRRGRIDRSMMRTYDVLPTLAGQIGLRLPRGLSGRSATSTRVRRRGRVKVISRAPLAHIAFSRGRLAQGRQGGGAAQARPVRLGRAQPVRVRRQPPAAGPAGRLPAGAPAAAPCAPRSPGHGTTGASTADSSFVPAHVTGRITGRRGGARRDIAVAVNGRIWAVTRSVRLRGSRAEYYSALVNPDSSWWAATATPSRSTRSAAHAASTCSAACAKVFRPLATGVTGGSDHRGARGSISAARLGRPFVRPRSGAVSP